MTFIACFRMFRFEQVSNNCFKEGLFVKNLIALLAAFIFSGCEYQYKENLNDFKCSDCITVNEFFKSRDVYKGKKVKVIGMVSVGFENTYISSLENSSESSAHYIGGKPSHFPPWPGHKRSCN